MKVLVLTSLALGTVFLLGVSSPAEATVASYQNDSNIVKTHWRHDRYYYYNDPYYYSPGYYRDPLVCVLGLCL
jgi:hypothetical protein